jgi:hypothetical protein
MGADCMGSGSTLLGLLQPQHFLAVWPITSLCFQLLTCQMGLKIDHGVVRVQ